MPVYRPVPQPFQGVKIATLIPQGGAVQAESRITVYTLMSGQTAVARPANSQWFFETFENGNTGVAKGAQTAFNFRTLQQGSGTVGGQVSSQTTFTVRSLLSGNATVQSGTPGFEASNLTMSVDVSGRREFYVGWQTQMETTFESKRSFTIVDLEMTRTGVRIDPVVIGDDFRVTRVYTGLPVEVVINAAWFTVKASEALADGAAVVQKMITTTPTAAGQIQVADASGGYLQMYFDPTRGETLNAAEGVTYVYDVQVRTTGNKIYTLEKGTITFISGVTTAIT